MRYSEQFMEHIEYAFHAFCKIVLRHEAMNAWRDLKRKEEREISLDYLMSERYFEPSAMDSYFEKQDKPTVFLVLGKEVIVDDERLATALAKLPELRKAVAGEPEAVDAVLRHYTAHIKYLSMYKGHINDDTQDRLKAKLVEAILKFRFDR